MFPKHTWFWTLSWYRGCLRPSTLTCLVGWPPDRWFCFLNDIWAMWDPFFGACILSNVNLHVGRCPPLSAFRYWCSLLHLLHEARWLGICNWFAVRVKYLYDTIHLNDTRTSPSSQLWLFDTDSHVFAAPPENSCDHYRSVPLYRVPHSCVKSRSPSFLKQLKSNSAGLRDLNIATCTDSQFLKRSLLSDIQMLKGLRDGLFIVFWLYAGHSNQ